MTQGAFLAEAVGGGSGLVASPYLARLVATVPDRDNSRWWTGAVPAPGRRGVIASLSVLLGALGGHGVGWSALLPAWIVLALFTAPLAVIDVELHRLPDRLVFAAAAAGAVLLVFAAIVQGNWSALLRAAEAGGVVFAIFLLIALTAPFGFGDVKLGAVLAAYLGWLGWGYVGYGILAGFVLAALASLPLMVSGRATMRSAIPLGPALIVGAFLVAGLHLVPSTGN